MPRDLPTESRFLQWRDELDRYGYDPDDLRLPPLCRSGDEFEQYAERRLVTAIARPQSRAQALLVAAIAALVAAFAALCAWCAVFRGFA